jgi:uncharacterized radical SAM protein YgiQ
MNEFLPINKQDLQQRGIEQLDFICVTGDAYVDHPSFGIAIISRVIEAEGFLVGVIAQPIKDSDFTKLSRPKYGFMVTSGNIDSMVSNYTAAKKKRSDDAYSAGGKGFLRPDRAVDVYCKKIRELYDDIPIVIGGLEASLRRFAHYDYWDDTVLPSILESSSADLLVFGMGESQVRTIVNGLRDGVEIKDMTDIRGTCYLTEPKNSPIGAVQCPDFKIVSTDKKNYAKACKIQNDQQDEVYGKTILQRHGDKMLVQNPPANALNQYELDRVYALSYARKPHPSYDKLGGVPAITEVEFSITHNRGCFGNCNFCSIALHQGRKITCRSHTSVLEEAEEFVKNPDFKGYIHDVGGPTANFRQPSCKAQLKVGLCKGKKCLAPTPCKSLDVSHSDYLSLLQKLRAIKGVKKVFIRSGIRYDYLLEDKDHAFVKELIANHVSGQLKVAPEHCSVNVLDKMGKPYISAYKEFARKFYAISKEIGKEQYLVPYLMSSHPNSTLADAIELALFLKTENIRPEQVQDFYPTPGTISTAMFYTGLDPYTMENVYVAKTSEEKAMQRALLQYFKPENKAIVIKALRIAGRGDLIGTNKNCLIEPNTSFVPTKKKNEGKKWQKTKNKR